jgi:integrase
LGIERSTLNFEKNYCKIKDAVKADINGRTYVGKTKTKASVRIQYFDAGIGKILQDYLAACNVDSKYLFCTANGTPISVRNMQRAWKMILKHANVRYRSFHYLRHSFITEMFIQGYAAADIAAVVGHSRLETTNKYALRRQDKVLEIAKTAANIYNIA